MDLWSLDECHFQQHGSRCAMWVAPEEDDPIVYHEPTRRSISLFGAVNLRSGRMLTMMISPFDSASFEAFLHYLDVHRNRHRRMHVILDNAAYHKAADLRPYLHSVRHRLQLDYLPPYSPELNPIERVWKLLRRLRLHNRYFPSLNDLVQEVSQQLALWAKPNSVLRRLSCIT